MDQDLQRPDQPRTLVGFACKAIRHPMHKGKRPWKENFDAAVATVMAENADQFFLECPTLSDDGFSCLVQRPSQAIQLASYVQAESAYCRVLVGIGLGSDCEDPARQPFVSAQSAMGRAILALRRASRQRPPADVIVHEFGQWDEFASHLLSLTLAVRGSWTERQHHAVATIEPRGFFARGYQTERRTPTAFLASYRRSHHAHVQAVEMELGNMLDLWYAQATGQGLQPASMV